MEPECSADPEKCDCKYCRKLADLPKLPDKTRKVKRAGGEVGLDTPRGLEIDLPCQVCPEKLRHSRRAEHSLAPKSIAGPRVGPHIFPSAGNAKLRFVVASTEGNDVA
jgi:hypothetical protein